MILEDFIGGSYPAQSKNANAQRTINLVPTITGTEGAKGKMPLMLSNAPGLELWKTLGDLPVRGTHVVDNTLYVVAGHLVYKVRNDGISTVIGELTTTTGKCWLEHNSNFQLGIVDGRNLYVYNWNTSAFVQVILTGQPTSLAFIDQYFVVSLANSIFFQISNINDALTWPAAQLAAAESSPDPLLVVWNLHRQLYLLGAQTTEIWYDAGTTPMPFQSTSGVIDWGLAAVDSVAQVADTLAWLGIHRDGGVSAVISSGLQSNVISTPGLEARWRNYSALSNARGFSYRQDGHDCYVLTFPSGNETFVYDFSTQLWHERESFGVGAWIAIDAVRLADKLLVGDRTTGKIYKMSPEITLENNNPIVGRRTSAHYWEDRKRIICHSLEVEFEYGALVPPTSSLEPKAQLRWSKDGGHTWSNWNETGLGKTGERERRAIWRRIGLSRDLMLDLQVANQTVTHIIGASAKFSLGES
jgi:hypothetical protein